MSPHAIVAVIICGWIAAALVIAYVHDCVKNRARVAAFREWAFEHCVSLAGWTKQGVRDAAVEWQRCVEEGTDMAELGRKAALRQQYERDREQFERMLHPSAGNGLVELDERVKP